MKVVPVDVREAIRNAAGDGVPGNVENDMLYDSVHRGWIGGVEVSSPTLYVVYGRSRGLLLGTDLIEEAREALWKDLELCRQQGVESDAEIYQWDYYYGHWKHLRWERRLLGDPELRDVLIRFGRYERKP